MSFRIRPLPRALFADLFTLGEAELAARGAVRRTAGPEGGFPCRVSLADAEPGEELILVHFEHHSAPTPFRASHAVYVRQAAIEADPAPGEVPPMLRSRILSLRGFDAAGMLVTADLADGAGLEAPLEAMLAQPEVEVVHLHFAKPGCYAARAVRGEAAGGYMPDGL
ncbi:MAG TPA: DUF1203 domain-containing protein [Allosphingosinicella sp.]|nr:DUF1203 domain-containing protein [Allosphingosinicella sp.]